MSRERARERRREAGSWLLVAWGVAIVPNVIEAFGAAPDGWAWTSLLVLLGAVFVVALVVFAARVVQELRAKRALS
jgi:hypothetical protein